MSAPRYLPHIDYPDVLSMAMQPLSGAWLETPSDPAVVLARKQALRAQHSQSVYQVLPEGRPAAVELARSVANYLRCDGVELSDNDDEALWRVSLQLHDDLVVMQPSADGYRLVAASLCSPSHWHLEDKIGRSMPRIHDPIPGIHQRLTPKIERIFARLPTSQIVERFNWSVQQGDGLFFPPGSEPETTALFYRVERQTLARLPDTGALAFTIAVHIDPLESLWQVEGAMAALFNAIDRASPELARYKGFPRLANHLSMYRQR